MVTQRNVYPELNALIQEQGLLAKQPLYYTYKVVTTSGLFVASITFLLVVDNFWLQLLNATFLAFVFGQIGYIGHDAGHKVIAKSNRINELLGLGSSFFINLSRSWWVTKHNQHHKTPNDLDLDPHTAIPLLVFSQEDSVKKKGFLRFLVGYQAFYFIPLLVLEGFGIRLASIQFLLQRKDIRYPVIEPILMIIHFLVYFGLLFYALNPLQVIAFVVVHQGLFGLYYGTVFAPNHKGMLIPDKDQPLDFLRAQVLTTRNIKPNPFIDFWYGGLNYQIEHHLFTNMPRNQLGKARKIIQKFCAEHEISYQEDTTLGAWRDILRHLHEVSAPLRSRWSFQKEGTI